MRPYAVMECLHRFCFDCVSKYLRIGRKDCPRCGTRLPSTRFMRPDTAAELVISLTCPPHQRPPKHFCSENLERRIPLIAERHANGFVYRAQNDDLDPFYVPSASSTSQRTVSSSTGGLKKKSSGVKAERGANAPKRGRPPKKTLVDPSKLGGEPGNNMSTSKVDSGHGNKTEKAETTTGIKETPPQPHPVQPAPAVIKMAAKPPMPPASTASTTLSQTSSTNNQNNATPNQATPNHVATTNIQNPLAQNTSNHGNHGSITAPNTSNTAAIVPPSKQPTSSNLPSSNGAHNATNTGSTAPASTSTLTQSSLPASGASAPSSSTNASVKHTPLTSDSSSTHRAPTDDTTQKSSITHAASSSTPMAPTSNSKPISSSTSATTASATPANASSTSTATVNAATHPTTQATTQQTPSLSHPSSHTHTPSPSAPISTATTVSPQLHASTASTAATTSHSAPSQTHVSAPTTTPSSSATAPRKLRRSAGDHVTLTLLPNESAGTKAGPKLSRPFIIAPLSATIAHLSGLLANLLKDESKWQLSAQSSSAVALAPSLSLDQLMANSFTPSHKDLVLYFSKDS